MRGGQNRVPTDPDTHPFTTDADKYQVIVAGGRRGLARGAHTWLLHADLRVVAAFRFDQWARECFRQHRVLGLAPRLLAVVWRRRNAAIHHVDIDHRATIGPGLMLMHRNGIFIGPVTIGDNALLHHHVTIGQRVAAGDQGVPRLGNDVWIGPGATITGAVTIGDGVTISAGSVVSRDIPDRALVAGNPGRVIASDYDNSAMLNYTVERPATTPEHQDRALREYAAQHAPESDPELAAVKAAIFIEDACDVTLRDEDIDLARIGTLQGMRAAVARAVRPA